MQKVLQYMDPTFTIFSAVAIVLVATIIIFAFASSRTAFRQPFKSRAIMNRSEIALFRTLRQNLPENWTLLCQVSYGAFLQNKNYNRYMSINCKRADFALLDASLHVAAVVEYQGGGHFGNSRDSRAKAEKSDAVKRQALSEAGIALIEVPAKFDQCSVASTIRNLTINDQIPAPTASAEKERNVANGKV